MLIPLPPEPEVPETLLYALKDAPAEYIKTPIVAEYFTQEKE
jgi:hypothetical protein